VYAVITICLALSFVFVVGEILVRVYFVTINPKRHYQPGLYYEDPERFWQLKANYRGHFFDYTNKIPTSTNSRGYRGPEETAERLSAELRVICIGDSIGFGRGVADGEPYPNQLEKLIGNKNVNSAVFNLCVPGYDTYLERITLEKHIDRIRPHVVILGWFRNDASANTMLSNFAKPKVIDGYLVFDESRYWEFKNRINRSSWRRSAFLRYLSAKWKLYKKKRKFKDRVQKIKKIKSSGLLASIDEVKKIQELCLARNIFFILLVHPTKEELFLNVSDIKYLAPLKSTIASDKFNKITNVVALVDDWSDLQHESLYLTGDKGHPSAIGHTSIAEILVELPVFKQSLPKEIRLSQ